LNRGIDLKIECEGHEPLPEIGSTSVAARETGSAEPDEFGATGGMAPSWAHIGWPIPHLPVTKVPVTIFLRPTTTR
jgi:hypothetical protein